MYTASDSNVWIPAIFAACTCFEFEDWVDAFVHMINLGIGLCPVAEIPVSQTTQLNVHAWSVAQNMETYVVNGC